jgi:YHS domain-containing protein
MDQMSRNDPSDHGIMDTQGMQNMPDTPDMPDTEGMRSLQEMESMRDTEDMLDTEGGIPGMTGPGSQGRQGMGDDSDREVQEALDPNPEHLDENNPNVARDPVCGVLVDKRTAQNTLASPVNEQMGTIYFHSAVCKALFEEDPHRYGFNF